MVLITLGVAGNFHSLSSYSYPVAILVSMAPRAHAHQLVGIWTTAKCIAMHFAHQLMRMCGPIETKIAAG
jgi:hypothetical protein